ncbi:hypothetical protein ABPG77_003745 [Micractinium sp. CCAP 211/92]
MQTVSACRLLLLAGALSGALSQQLVSTVNELKNEIYTPLPLGPGHAGDACVRLLHASGTVGCAAPTGAQPTEGRLVRLETLRQPDEYPDDAVYLLPPALLADFLLQCRDSPSLAGRVRGVLSEPGPAPSYSQGAAAPLAEFALYANRSYPWNPAGKGLNGLALPFPVFLLDDGTAENAQRRAAYNAEQQLNGALHHAKMRLTMQAAGNSSACLAARTCLPLGGHSVVAALPALPPPTGNGSSGNGTMSSGGGGGGSSGGDDMPAIWVLAQFDTAGLFHEAAVGAESPVSGLIAMLAAAEVLGSAEGSAAAGQYRERYRRRIVFAALGGEPWGLMGSKRLLWEAASGAASVAGFNITPGGVAAVLEVGPVGRARPGAAGAQRMLAEDAGGVSLYAHTPAGGATAAAGVLGALQAAASNVSAVVGTSVSVAPASAALPGLPPTTSAASFVRVLQGSGGNASSAPPAVLLSDFDTAFQGSTFQSSLYDNISLVDADSIAAVAVVVARAAHALALGEDGAAGAAAELPVNYTAVQASVQGLMQCLMNTTQGLGCPFAQAMMTPVSQGHLSHYIGILRSLTADPQTPDANIKSDYERFLWNWLAFATRPKPPGNSSDGGGDGGGDEGLQRCQPLNATACPPGFVCAGSRSIKGPEGQGMCLNATVRFVPSYSTSLLCDACDGANTNYEFRWQLTDAAAQWEQQHGWPADPLWAESNWPNDTPALTLYLKEDPAVEMALLGAGLAVAGASVAAALLIRFAHRRKLKRH